MKGDVTTRRSILGLPASRLEDVLGYKRGRLSLGYEVWELREPVFIGDFVWSDRTSYSGGWQFQHGISEYARRFDILRGALGKRYGYDEARVDQELNRFLQREADRLNVRTGDDRIVKIRPAIHHNDNLHWLDQYPNSGVRGIRQWTLVKEKRFAKVAEVQAGKLYY
jgi:hypothetical protein